MTTRAHAFALDIIANAESGGGTQFAGTDVLELARAYVGMGWQEIETAPPNRIVLMFGITDRSEDGKVRNWKMETGVRYVSPDEFEWGGRRIKEYDHQPTHWQTLPPLPSEGRDV